ncbi:D-amino-acid transaminase [Shimia sp. NS0008-38b]|uniref:D-amino acid aminotransferase n=1 Tax=Shimia sp. NS0008-38b TaxID=3127653 RepID=UPI0031032E2E
MRIVYVNGHFVPEDEAKISVFDRGFLFADAIYEVTSVADGKMIDFEAHMARLKRSMRELDFEISFDNDELRSLHQEIIDQNDLAEGVIYLQVTRGAADRDFNFSEMTGSASVVLFSQVKKLVENPSAKIGASVQLVEDKRWLRADIKTVQLLYSSLVKTRAIKAGFDDVWMHRDGLITEGSSSNVYIVNDQSEIITHQLNDTVLHGITRRAVLAVAESLQMKVIERAFSIEELLSAKEAFATSASGFVNPVVNVENHAIGGGAPGPVSTALRNEYMRTSMKMV